MIIEAANGSATTSAANATFTSHTEGALQSLVTYLTAAGINVGNLLNNLR